MSALPKEQPHVPSEIPGALKDIPQAGMSIGTAITLCTGLLFGVIYFWFCFAIPEYYRGVTFGDSADYMAYSRGSIWDVLNHSNHRLFGYPLFLAIFRQFYSSPFNEFLLPAMATQLVVYFASCLLLVYGLRRAEIRVPAFVGALVLVHPPLVSMTTIAMTDSLTSSLITMAIALAALLTYSEKYFVQKAIFLGVILSIGLSFRPSLIPFSIITPCVIAGSIWLRDRRSGMRTAQATRRALLLIVMYAVGFLPVYIKLRINCYNAHHEQCIMPVKELNRGMHTSFGYSLIYSRWDIFFRPDGVPEEGPTFDIVFPHASCSLSKEEPTKTFLQCYLQNWSILPLHLFRRLMGVFDHRHLNLYAGFYTPSWVFYMNRIFSAIGFAGVFGALALYLRCLYARQPGAHLLLPLIYTAIQVHFHPEARYMFPVVAVFFVVALTMLFKSPFAERWQRMTTWIAALGLISLFCFIHHQWDVAYFARFGHY